MNAFITQLGIYMRDYRVQNPAVQMTLMAWSSIARMPRCNDAPDALLSYQELLSLFHLVQVTKNDQHFIRLMPVMKERKDSTQTNILKFIALCDIL